MEWYTGPVADAVALVQRERKLLVVYVNDNVPEHRAVDAVWTDAQVIEAASSNKAVALRLDVGTPDAQMFASIYPVFVFPTTYIIAPQGSPLQVIAGACTAEDLAAKLSAAHQSLSVTASPASSPAPTTAAAVPNSVPAATSSASPQPSARAAASVTRSRETTRAASEPQQQKQTAADARSGTASPTPPVPQEGESLEDRAAKLREYIAQKRQTRSNQEAEEEKDREIRRRRDGQAIQRQQREMEDVQKRKLAEEVKRQRMEEKAARDRVRAQIEEDRRNRMAEDEARRRAAAGQSGEPQQQTARPTSSTGSSRGRGSTANLQFRFSDGSVTRHQFSADQTLADVRDYLLQNGPNLTREMQLLMSFPSRTFTEDDMGSALADLGLCPSATLIVKERAVARAGSGSGGFGAQLWALLQVVMSFLALLNPFRYFGGGGGSSGSGGRAVGGGGDGGARDTTRKVPSRSSARPGYASAEGYDARPSGQGISRRVGGNVHRLNTEDGSDPTDRTDTYNGNSTQQQ